MVGGRSSSGGSVRHLVVVCVVLERVIGQEARVGVGSLVVCCAGWQGFWW